jgi:hypothetical protein
MRAIVLQPLLKRYTAKDLPVNHQKGALPTGHGAKATRSSQEILLTGVVETQPKCSPSSGRRAALSYDAWGR